VRKEGRHGRAVRQAGTNYPEQTIDRSLIAQVKAA